MIYIFAAHPDDIIIGCGGTVAKYVKDKKKVTSVAFSYGENRNPILDPSYITKKLIAASKKSFKLLGPKTVLIGLPDSKLKKNLNSNTEKKIKSLFRKNPPKIVIIPDLSSTLSSHRAVAKFIIRVIKELKLKPQIYVFEIDMPIKLFRRETPKLYVDITNTYEQKQKAIELFKSHADINAYFEFINKIRDTFHGMKIGAKQAEVFYKL
jgi:LmbE family N-acetylglucosaminyl deacetylase